MSHRNRSGVPVGILRVERNFARSCIEAFGANTRFCYYDPGLRQLVPMPIVEASALLNEDPIPTPTPAPRRRGRVLRIGRSFERSFRLARRRFVTGPIRGAVRRLSRVAPPSFEQDDVLVLVSVELPLFDLALLRRLKTQHGLRVAVLVHDLTPVLFPQWFEHRALPALFDRYMQFAAEESDLVMAVSEATKRDFLIYAARHGRTQAEVSIVPLGSDVAPYVTAATPAKFAGLRPREFVLSVSTIQVRKNHQLLYWLWRRMLEESVPELPVLVIAGRPGYLTADLMALLGNDPLVCDKIRVVHDADDSELAWAYANCRFTLYPSIYEGWGLPIAESLSHGRFCIASAAASMPEVSGGLAHHLDPLDFRAWYDCIVDLLKHPERLGRLEQRIRAEYRPINWAQAGAAFTTLLSEFAGQRPN